MAPRQICSGFGARSRGQLVAAAAVWIDNNASHVVPARGADDMRRQGRTALGADRQLARFLAIVRTTLPSPRIRMFPLRDGHDSTPVVGLPSHAALAKPLRVGVASELVNW